MKLRLVLIFFIVVGVVALLLEYEKSDKIAKYIKKEDKEHQAMYNAIYHSFKKRADIASTLILNNQEILDIYKKLQTADTDEKTLLREELRQIVEQNYSILKTEGIYILHFHLKNSESFFRMHKPGKFGDDLSSNRKTLIYVNEQHKEINGFEVGRYFSGYRFIYPITSKDNEHLGSVEISFNLTFYIQEFMKTLDVVSNFRIKKEIVDARCIHSEIPKCYEESKIIDYYIPKHIWEGLDGTKKADLKDTPMGADTVKKGVEYIEKGQTVSIFDNKSQKLITFIPVQNSISDKVCGFITIRSDDKYIYNKQLNSYFILITFSLFTFIGLLMYYRKVKSQKLLNIVLQQEVEKKTKELQQINDNLEIKIKEEVAKNIEHEVKLIKQAKQAALGEMIGNIAHQWRQPLSLISSIASGIKARQEFGMLDKDTITQNMDSIMVKTQYLSETVETFRNYLKEKKEKQDVILQDRIKMAIAITKTSLEDNRIEFVEELDTLEPISMKIVAGELTEVLINLINNAKDILVEKKTPAPWVKVALHKNDDKVVITIEDNGGGIPEDILPKVFEEFFTTKDDAVGTGLGLHMSKKIIEESLKGKLYVQNSDFGAKFFVELPCENENS